MADGSTPPKGKMNWNSTSKNLVFWMLIVLLSVAFYRMTVSRRDNYQEIPYTTFRVQLDDGNVAIVCSTSRRSRGALRSWAAR